MTTHDIYLLSPEISMAGLAILLILVDLVVSRKSILTIVAVLGLAVPLALSIRHVFLYWPYRRSSEKCGN